MKKMKLFVLIVALSLTTVFPIGVLAAEASPETETIEETKGLAETEDFIETEEPVGTEDFIETEESVGTEDFIETEESVETEDFIETEESVGTEETSATEILVEFDETVTIETFGVTEELALTSGQEITENKMYAKAAEREAVQYANKDIYNFVVRMYDKFLDRPADPEGLDAWYKKLESREMEAADIVDGFISSKEFQGRNLTTEGYLNILYEGMLGRKPDSTGLKAWTTILEDGVSRKYISAQFVNSPEFIKLCDSYKINKGDITLVENRDQDYDVTKFVSHFYNYCLNRSGDVQGLNDWTGGLLDKSMTGSDIAQGFLFSKEFIAKGLNAKEFIEILYRTLLSRTSDEEGMATWTDCLENGVSNSYVLAGFTGSKEFSDLCDTYGIVRGDVKLFENRDQNYDVTKFVSHFYNYCLNRSGDVQGLNDWTGGLLDKSMTGSDIAQGFLFSKEFIAKGLNDKEFIEILYRTLLSRTSDEEGMAAWTDCLENGVSNSYVLAGFAGSKEFSDLCDTYGIVRGDVKLFENRDQNYELTSLVNQLFKECLGYKPQGEELNHKLGQLFGGSLSAVDLAEEFFNSSFYQSKNRDAAAFVTDLYNLVLRRQPSTEEVHAGVELVTKSSMAEAIQSALITKEFSQKCDSYHIELLNYSKNPAMWYAKEILDQVGWDMAAAFRWSHTALRYSGVGTPPAGVSHVQWYGKYGYENRCGNCYVMAATFYWMAKTVGWEAYFVEGYVPLARGGMGPHGWVEVVRDGTTYVCDPDFTYESGRNGYFITYGTSGTWRYSNYHRAD